MGSASKQTSLPPYPFGHLPANFAPLDCPDGPLLNFPTILKHPPASISGKMLFYIKMPGETSGENDEATWWNKLWGFSAECFCGGTVTDYVSDTFWLKYDTIRKIMIYCETSFSASNFYNFVRALYRNAKLIYIIRYCTKKIIITCFVYSI